jgi:hypothetical protein
MLAGGATDFEPEKKQRYILKHKALGSQLNLEFPSSSLRTALL